MLIHNATLWDGSGAASRRHTSLRIEGDRLAWIGPGAQAPAGESGEPVVDAGGRHVLPGLIDLHVHLTADTTQPDFVRYFLTTSVAEQTLVGAQHSRLMLEAGFTATRDLGAVGFANVALKRAIDAGRIPGPRVAACGSFLTVPGGHGDNTLRPDIPLPSTHVITGPTEARRAVREQVKYGADWIKLLATGGVMTGGTALGAALWEDDEIQAAVAMARRLGRPVAAHCHGADGIIMASKAGVTSIEHGTMANEEAAAVMARHGTVLVPTFSAAAGVVCEAKAGRLPPAITSQALAIEPMHADAFRAARDAGVRIASGSDTGVPGTTFGENARELGYLVAHGFTATEALLAATRDAATVLGWADRIGTLEVGKLADLIVVDGDPAEDVDCLSNLSRIHLVLKGGRIAADRR